MDVKEFYVKLNFINKFLFSLAIAFTMPTVDIYMIREVDPAIYKFSIWLKTVLIFAVVTALIKGKVLDFAKRAFNVMVCIVVILIITFNYLGIEYNVTYRFIGLAIVDTLGSTLWATVVKDIFNNTYSGSEITIFNSKCKFMEKLGGVIGGLLIIPFDLDVHLALNIQAVTYVMMGVLDIIVRNKLTPTIELNNQESL